MIAAIEHRTKPTSGDSQLGCDVLDREEKILEDRRVFEAHIQYVGHVRFRNDEHVHRRLRADVAEREDTIVFENLLRGQGALDDFAEDTLFGFSLVVRSHGPAL